jgi:acyl carrier protein
MQPVLSDLIPLVANRYNIAAENLNGETTMESIGIDSLGQIELMFDLEDHFHIRFGDHQELLKTLQEVADLIDQCRKTDAS